MKIIGGMIYIAVQGVTDSAIPTSAHIDIPEIQEASDIHGPLRRECFGLSFEGRYC